MREVVAEHHASIASDPFRFRQARRWIMRLVLEAGYSPQDAHDLAVAFSEACANVHRHAYDGRRDGRVELRVTIDEERVEVALDHDGRPFEPEGYASPDLRRPSESGYGLYLIASLVDEVSFEGTDSGGRTVLVKRNGAATWSVAKE